MLTFKKATSLIFGKNYVLPDIIIVSVNFSIFNNIKQDTYNSREINLKLLLKQLKKQFFSIIRTLNDVTSVQ